MPAISSDLFGGVVRVRGSCTLLQIAFATIRSHFGARGVHALGGWAGSRRLSFLFMEAEPGAGGAIAGISLDDDSFLRRALSIVICFGRARNCQRKSHTMRHSLAQLPPKAMENIAFCCTSAARLVESIVFAAQLPCNYPVPDAFPNRSATT